MGRSDTVGRVSGKNQDGKCAYGKKRIFYVHDEYSMAGDSLRGDWFLGLQWNGGDGQFVGWGKCRSWGHAGGWIGGCVDWRHSGLGRNRADGRRRRRGGGRR